MVSEYQSSNYQLSNLQQRLYNAGSPREASMSNKSANCVDYAEVCQLNKADIPGLIELLSWWRSPDEFYPEDWDEDDDAIQLLPVTAWRCLAALKATEAITPMVEMLDELGADIDDWSLCDFPHVFAAIGIKSVEPLKTFLLNSENGSTARICATDSLAEIGLQHPDSRDQVVAFLVQQLEPATEDDIDFNSGLISALMKLNAVEAAETIERAYAGNLIDVGYWGDWEAVRTEFGIEGLGLEMPEKPYDSMDDFRLNTGVNVFSAVPLGMADEFFEDAAEAYLETACKKFEGSEEGKSVVERYQQVHWVHTFLDYALQYLGVTVNNINRNDAEEVLFEIFPRKVSVEASAAEEIVFELRKFWEFVYRVHKLESAKQVLKIFDGDTTSELFDELSDPENFGMAKSMVMMGKNAGFDMSSQSGMNQFMAAYNESVGNNLRTDPGSNIVAKPTRTAAEQKEFDKQRKKKLAKKLKAKKRK